MESLAWMSAADLAACIAAAKLSAVEAVSAAIERIEKANRRLNAVVELDAGNALEAAALADRALDAGLELEPLHGVPLAHKDMFDRAGKAAGCGARQPPEPPAAADATAIRRLAEGGAITLGALHMSEYAFGLTGHNAHLGACRNPWSPAHMPGGSSSGPAAAVAAGLVPLALGSDTGGSLRVPAACCGLVSLRPTWGRVGRGGAMPLSFSLDAIGPLARTVDDVALALDLIAGADPRDPTAADMPVPNHMAALNASARGRRIGVDETVLADTDAALHPLFDQAIGAFREAGAIIVPVKLPDLEALDRWAQLLQSSEASAVHAHRMRTRPEEFSEQVRARLESGYAIAAVDYLQAQRQRPIALAEARRGMLATADAVIMPVLSGPVPTLAATDVGGGPAMTATLNSILRFTRPVSYLGVPVLTLPLGFTPDGLPNGFQLIGQPFGEPDLLAFGSAYCHLRNPLEGRHPIGFD